jgi:probable F420-dependent oxidoreductase
VSTSRSDGGAPIGWLLTPGTTPVPAVAAHIRLLEKLGYDSAWLGEAFREVIVPLAAASSATNKIRLGSGVLQIFPVNPVMVAQQAAQLAQLSGKRFILGLGLGADFVVERWYGVLYERQLQRAREFLEVIRGVLLAPREGPFSFDGEIFQVSNYPLPFLEEPLEVPLYLAAVGPKMQQLAGELADGIVVGGVNSPRYLEEVRRNLEVGAARAGRSVDQIEIVYAVPSAVWDEAERARGIGRGTIAYTTQYPHYRKVWQAEGYGRVAEEIAELVRGHDMDRAPALVSDEMLDHYAVVGTPEECRRQLHRYRAYPGRPILSAMPFRMSDEEVMESLRLAARGLPTSL